MIAAIGRLALAAVALACALWLLPASVHIASWPAAGPVRVAYLAPLGRLWTAIAIVLVVFAALTAWWRRTGGSLNELASRTSPLLLLWFWLIPYLPWLADRAPLMLVFAGPIRWVIAACAMAGVMARTVDLAQLARHVPAPRRRVVFAISIVVYATLGVRYARDAGFGGDEPHYLIITQSLLADRDLDIANNHAQRDYRAYFPGDLRPDFLQRGLHGEIYSIHAPGLPALLLPAFAGAGALGAVVFMALLAALAALAIFDAAALLTNARTAALVWIATCFTVPFVPHAWLIYPEAAGALIAAWAVLWLLRPPRSVARTFVHGLVFAALPWLHTKFALLLAFFVLFETLRMWPRWKHIAALTTPIAVSGLAWLYSFHAMYGVYDPEAPYGSYTRMFVLATNIPRGTLGLLFDQKFGILVYSPVYLLAIGGAWVMLRDRGRRLFGIAVIVTAAAFFVSTTRLYMWWGGSSAPARFLVPIVPLLAPLIAVAVAQLDNALGRASIAITTTVSIAIAIMTLMSPGEELLYSNPHGVSALISDLQGSAPFDIWLPTFTEENWRAPIGALVPWLAALAAVCAAAAVLGRRRRQRSDFWMCILIGGGFLVSGSLLASIRQPPSAVRAGLVTREQIALMRDYDPTRTHAADVTHVRRLRDDEALAAAALSIRRPANGDVGDPRVLEGPFELPEGRYEARLWFDAARAPAGEAFVALSDRIALARAETSVNPVRLPFALPIRTPAFVGVSDLAVARAVRRVDIAAVSLVPRSHREPLANHVVEPLGDGGAGFMAYADDHTYPEGGVFWTRGTEAGTIVIATAGAPTIRLILHVGPSGGPVTVDAGSQRMEVDLEPDETREITVNVPAGAATSRLTIRAARSFRPSDVDPKSDDRRLLGCQVRPLLAPS